ncbi:MAG: 5-(carboxyamino)imidazole ribonucleotide mutase [Candidatus Methanosuratincola petrocarbonis]|uniref:N5-carboxyaminoimidazole ribonucleotide mutase n=1 Tax=Methanosuratincola subterraneus TaxID=2593994 RepID=A0A3S3TT96_METS7|nr:5-(carboxyamino)imidazole ribonucleotide mutase [Candidatus Methanosuratincola sp.]RWX74143.1 MAG: N5-carboxyaminoimidazole ribonucleotide mutase [Candidatus Methanosuratincola subterraneus]
MPKASVIVGSKSDEEIGSKVKEALSEFGVEADFQVISAHRDPERLDAYIKGSDSEVFIAVAGLAAALPGVIASKTTRPVIGVPRDVRLGGLDALLSIVQMPPGVPVATVGVDNWKNAALLAVEILALKHPELSEKLEMARRSRT